MKIGVITRVLYEQKIDGIGVFTRETMQRIVRDHPEHQFIFYFDTSYDPIYIFGENVTPVVIPPRGREPLGCLFWQEVILPKQIRRDRIDMLLSPEPVHSLRSSVPVLSVVHDLNFMHRPEVLPKVWQYYYLTFGPRYARAAARLATVSHYSREDIVKTFGIDREKIDVVYNGAIESYRPLAEEEAVQFRNTLTGGLPYFYFVGTIHQRKNIANMLRGFELFRQRGAKEMKLVIAGRRKWWSSDMEEAWRSMKYQSDVVFAGRVDDSDLANIAGASDGLVYIPFFEGFGIPILEAFQAGVPVMTADVTSMPEVAGEGGLLVDPENVEEIALGMERLATDQALRERLIAGGDVQRRKFSWDRTAELLWESIMKLAVSERLR